MYYFLYLLASKDCQNLKFEVPFLLRFVKSIVEEKIAEGSMLQGRSRNMSGNTVKNGSTEDMF